MTTLNPVSFGIVESALPFQSAPQIVKEKMLESQDRAIAKELDLPLFSTRIGFAKMPPSGTIQAVYKPTGGQWLPYPRSPTEILFAFLSAGSYPRDLFSLLQTLGPDFDERPFLLDLLEQEEKKLKRIYQLSGEDLITVLPLFQKHGISIDKSDLRHLLFRNPQSAFWNERVIQSILSIDPSLIRCMHEGALEQAQGICAELEKYRASPRSRLSQLIIPDLEEELTFYQRTFLEHAILRRHTKVTACLLEAACAQGVSLSQAEQALVRASELQSFTEEELATYSPSLLDALFQAANVYVHISLLEQVRALKSAAHPSEPRDFSLCSDDMDFIQAQKAVNEFFHMLRREGRLFTLEECQANLPFEGRVILKRVDPIGRILGKEKLEKAIKSLNLEHLLGVPRKILVCEQEAFDLSISKEADLHVYNSDGSLSLIAEKITLLDRHATKEELEAVFQVVQATGYSDFGGAENFVLGRNLLGEEKIYFLDTERKSFFLGFHHANPFFQLVAPQDLEWLQGKIKTIGTQQYDQFEKSRAEQSRKDAQRHIIFEQHGYPYRNLPFHVVISKNYTGSDSKIGIWQSRRPEFGPDVSRS